MSCQVNPCSRKESMARTSAPRCDKFKTTSDTARAEYQKRAGFKCSYMLHLKKHEILFMDFEYIENFIKRLLNFRCVYIFENNNTAIDTYFSCSYLYVCLNISNCKTDIEMDTLRCQRCDVVKWFGSRGKFNPLVLRWSSSSCS